MDNFESQLMLLRQKLSVTLVNKNANFSRKWVKIAENLDQNIEP
jgi:hypothetical protein